MWLEVKRIKGRRYLYLRWRANGKTKSLYLGRAEEDGTASGFHFTPRNGGLPKANVKLLEDLIRQKLEQ